MPEDEERIQDILEVPTIRDAQFAINLPKYGASLVVVIERRDNRVIVFKKEGYHPPEVFQKIHEDHGIKLDIYVPNYSVYQIDISDSKVLETLEELKEDTSKVRYTRFNP